MHILVEAAYMCSHWCTHYIKGIAAQAKRKNIQIAVHSSADFSIDELTADSCVIMLGSSMSWAAQTMHLLHTNGIRPIVLSLANYQKQFPFASFISMDYDDASRKLMKYLEEKGCRRTALFAVDPQSATDSSKVANFLLEPRHAKTDIFTYTDTLHATCSRLIDRIQNYDSVICANDIAAVILMKRLSEIGITAPDRIHIATFGDTVLSSLGIQNITIAKVKSAEAGKLAINAYNLLKTVPSLSSLAMLLHCDILGAGGEKIDVQLQQRNKACGESSDGSTFFSDPDVSEVLLVEKLLSGCDKLDVLILRELLNRESYSKIAAKLFVAENTISYRIKRILSMAPEKTKEEVFDLLAQFLV